MITTRRILSRRTVLRGAVGGSSVALALPLLEAMLTPRGALAEGAADEPIFGLFYWANGTPRGTRVTGRSRARAGTRTCGRRRRWGPTTRRARCWRRWRCIARAATGLEPKTEIPADPPGQSDGHMRGLMNALTADRIRPEGFDHPSHTLTVLRPTIDQVIASHAMFFGSAPSRFRSLELGVSEARFHDYGHWNRITFTGPDQPMPQISSPAQLYQMLFGFI